MNSRIPENTTIRKLDPFPSSGEGTETPTLLGPLERANLNHWTKLDIALSKGPNTVSVSLRHLRTEKDPVSESLCLLVFRIPDDG
jgi:hypothetical protein